jgi:hypothetical protein
MPTNPALRNRMPSEQVSGGMSRIRMGVFGTGSPAAAFETEGNSDSDGLYQYHEGNLFSPGAGNWVFEPNFELPLITIWGNAFLRVPNTFDPIQPPQIYAQPTVQNNGLGGLEAGQYQLTGLSFEEPGYEGGGVEGTPLYALAPSQIGE